MSNERIDLTQFEGATEGPWETIEPEHPHYGVIRIKPCSATVRRYQSDFRSEETWHANAKAIAAVPELIAELKKCYEEIDEVRWMLMQAYDGQKEREREIDYLRSYCLDNGVCPYCGAAQQDPALRENLGILKMCSSCEDKTYFGIEPNDNASE